jgi:hypothetical protein
MKLSASFILNTEANTKAAQANMQQLADKTNKVRDAVEQTNKSSERLKKSGGFGGVGLDPQEHRRQRGIAGNRAAAGRDFAGMARGAGDTSGFVAAYATVAASLFAVTAAFQALNNAAKFDQLTKGLQLVGAQAGITLSLVSKSLQEVTGFGLSTAEAMKVTAQATASGIGADKLQALGKIAKGASSALGRDLSDSMDRLIRGVAKLEPELIDELGIMTRLDDAMRAYALANNKTVSSLTLTEKSQAFLNAVLDEGNKKFGSIAEQMDVNPYDKLLAKLKDLGTTIAELTNNVLKPLVSIFTLAPAAAIIPFMGVINAAATKVLPTFASSLKKAGEEFDALTAQEERANLLVKSPSRGVLGSSTKPTEGVRQRAIIQQEVLAGQGMAVGLNAETMTAFSNAIFGEGNPLNVVKQSGKAIGDIFAATKGEVENVNTRLAAAGVKMNILQKTSVLFSVGLKGAGAAATVLGITLNTLLPWIGIITASIATAVALYQALKSEAQKASDEAKKALQEVMKNAKEVQKQVELSFSKANYSAGIEAAIGSMNELIQKTEEFRTAKEKAEKAPTAMQDWTKGFIASFAIDLFKPAQVKEFEKFSEAFLPNFEAVFGPEQTKQLNEEMKLAVKNKKDYFEVAKKAEAKIENQAKLFTDIASSAKSTGDAIRKYYGESFFKTAYSDISAGFEQIQAQINSSASLGIKNYGTSVFDSLAKGGREYFQEIDRLAGGNGIRAVEYYDTIQEQENEYQKAVKEGRTKDAESFRKTINGNKAALVGIVQESKVLIKGQLENLKILYEQNNVALLKLKQTLVDIQSSNAKIAFDIKSTSRDAARVALVGSYKSPVDESQEKALELAKFELSNAKNIAAIKNKVLDAEFNLNNTQLKLAIFKAKQENLDLNKQINEAQKAGKQTAPEEIQQMLLQMQVIKLLEDQFKINEDIRDANKQNNSLQVQAAKQKVNLATEEVNAYNNAYDVQQRINSAVEIQINHQKTLLDIAREKRDLEFSIEELKAKNEARRQGREFNSAEFEIKTLEESIRRAKTASLGIVFSSLPAISKLRNEIAAEQRLQDFGTNLGGTVTQERQDLLNRLRTEETNLVTQLGEKLGLANLDLQKLIEELGLKLPVTINEITNALSNMAREQVNLSRVGFGANLAGAGNEFQTALNMFKEGSNKSIVEILADPESVKAINKSAMELKEAGLQAEFFDTVSASINNNMISAFTSIIDGSASAGQAFTQMAQGILRDIAAMIAKMLVFKLIQTSLNAVSGGTGDAFMKFMGMANGGVMPMANGGLMDRARGIQGIVNKPTYLVGEGKYNEAVVPLPNGREIPVQLQGSSSNSNSVNVVVNMSGNGSQASTETQGQDMDQLGRAVAAAVQRELINQKRPGGILSKYGAA